MELWLATGNKGKVAEFRSLLSDIEPTIKQQNDLKMYFAPDENGSTFYENAAIKAKSLKALVSGKWVIAEDSGLEVEGLNNLPGIHSARYAGPKATDDENNAKILKMVALRTPTNRLARFKCTIVAFSPEGTEHVFEGEVEGEISQTLKRGDGFGYDYCFIPKGEEKTFSELGMAYKNDHSHRAKAIALLKAELIK